MTSTSSAAAPVPAAPGASRWRQYLALTKPRVVQLIVFCALIGMLLAVPGLASAAAAFNCLIEQEIDARMKRTAWRPTANGELSRRQALVFSAVLCAAGMVLL